MKIAKGEIGQKEILGSRANPRILEYFRTLGHSWVKDDETPFCAAFLGWVLEKAGLGSTRKLNARSYLQYGTKVDNPQYGDIVVFWRVNKNGPYGHVGFFTEYSHDGDIMVLGGNQNNAMNISEFSKERVLEFRRPNYPAGYVEPVATPKPTVAGSSKKKMKKLDKKKIKDIIIKLVKLL